MNEVDVVLWLVEPTNFIGAGEQHIIEQLKKVNNTCYIDYQQGRYSGKGKGDLNI